MNRSHKPYNHSVNLCLKHIRIMSCQIVKIEISLPYINHDFLSSTSLSLKYTCSLLVGVFFNYIIVHMHFCGSQGTVQEINLEKYVKLFLISYIYIYI